MLFSKSEENTQSAVLLSNIEYLYFIMVENIFIIFHNLLRSRITSFVLMVEFKNEYSKETKKLIVKLNEL